VTPPGGREGQGVRIGQAGRRGLVAVLLALVAVLVAATGLGATSAAFSATTSNPGNTLAADRLAPPGSLDVTASCAGAAAPIAFRGSSTATGTDTLTLPIPAGTLQGDVLVAQVGTTNVTAALTAPAGWTPAGPTFRNQVSVAATLYWKVAGAGEPDPTFTLPVGTNAPLIGGLAGYSGVSTTAPVDTYGAAGNGSSVSAIQPYVTTATAGTMVVRFIAVRAAAFSSPTETTERLKRSDGPLGVTAADEQFAGPGITSKRFFSSPTSAPWVGQTVALKRGAAAPSAEVSWTPTPSPWADGYRLERQVGTAPPVQQTLARGATSYTDPSLTAGTTYTYRLSASAGTWRSDALTATVTPTC
jgi:hypothetical protein